MSNTGVHSIRWLVEVNGEQFGPMTTHQIVERLMRKEFRVAHRVSETGAGWAAICNEPVFERHVENLIEQVAETISEGSRKRSVHESPSDQDFGELSGIHQIDVKSLGISDQLTHAKELQQASTNLSLLRSLLSEIRMKRKVIVTAPSGAHKSDVEMHPDDRDEYIEAPRKIEDFFGSGVAKILYIASALVIFLVAGFKFKVHQEEQAERERVISQQENLIRSKYGVEAKVSKFDEMNLNQLMGEIQEVLRVGGDGRVEKQKIALNRGDVMTWFNVETKVPSNVAEQKELYPVVCKRAYELFLEGELAKAEEFLLKALLLHSESKVDALVLLLEVAILMKKPNSRNVRFSELVKLYDRFMILEKQNQSRILIAKLRALVELKLNEDVLRVTKQFLLDHPRGEVNGTILGFRERSSWDNLVNHCISIYKSNSSHLEMSALLSACLIRSSQKEKAEPYAYYAWRQEPKNTLIKDQLSYVYLKTGKVLEAKKLLWDRKEYAFNVTDFQKASRIEFCLTYPGDRICSGIGRGTASGNK